MDIVDVETGSQPLTERQTTTKRAYPLRKSAAKKLRAAKQKTDGRERGGAAMKVMNTSAAVKDTGPTKPGKYYGGSYERY